MHVPLDLGRKFYAYFHFGMLLYFHFLRWILPVLLFWGGKIHGFWHIALNLAAQSYQSASWNHKLVLFKALCMILCKKCINWLNALSLSNLQLMTLPWMGTDRCEVLETLPDPRSFKVIIQGRCFIHCTFNNYCIDWTDSIMIKKLEAYHSVIRLLFSN